MKTEKEIREALKLMKNAEEFIYNIQPDTDITNFWLIENTLKWVLGEDK
ncbi:MAG: hypothetical protein ACE5WD_14860 [Candidatus Aminicenantia bacterium]